MYKGPTIRDGALALLGSMLESDEVEVWLSGRSRVQVVQGIPEGGSLGSLGYNLLPDTLIRTLEGDGHGIGLFMQVPVAWKDHAWCCVGSPVDAVVVDLRARLRFGGPLPPSQLLKVWPHLEASAARALDLESEARLACMFHADDPIFFASSQGAMQLLLDAVSAWAQGVGAAFDVGPQKTVGMVAGSYVPCEAALTFEGSRLALVGAHRWLGVLWPADLDFRAYLLSRLQAASGAVAQLAGFASSRMIPWYMVGDLFETKVDSLLAMGRWLFCMVDDAQVIIDGYYEGWARLFLGADPWRNAATCMSKVGWKLSGFARVVRAVALRRASLWLAGTSDWHASFFFTCGTLTGSWSSCSASLLRQWSVADWPEWQGVPKTYQKYKCYVNDVLAHACFPSWQARVQLHRSYIPYGCFDPAPGLVVERCRREHLPHDVNMQLRSWLRLRCGLLVLSHREGRRSAARYQSCTGCATPWCTAYPNVHAGQHRGMQSASVPVSTAKWMGMLLR